MIKDVEDLTRAQADPAPDTVDHASDLAVLQSLVDGLEHEKATLLEGLKTRQQIGFVTGVLGQRYGLQPDAAWNLLSHVSQKLNVKAVRVADILLAAYTGQLAPQEEKLAMRIFRLLPAGSEGPH